MDFKKAKELYIEYIKENDDDMSKLSFFQDIELDNKKEALSFFQYIYNREKSLDVIKSVEGRMKELKKTTISEKIFNYMRIIYKKINDIHLDLSKDFNGGLFGFLIICMVIILGVILFVAAIVNTSNGSKYVYENVIGATNEMTLLKIINSHRSDEDIRLRALNKLKIDFSSDLYRESNLIIYDFLNSYNNDDMNILYKNFIEKHIRKREFMDDMLFLVMGKSNVDGNNIKLLVKNCDNLDVLRTILIYRKENEDIKHIIRRRITNIQNDIKEK